MIKNIEAVEKSLGIEAGKLSEIITSEEEHEINLDNRINFSKDDYESRIKNIKKDEFVRGQDLLLREMKEGQELDYDGRKDPAKFIEALIKKTEKESSIEPEKRFSDLKTNFEKLQGVNQGLQNKYDDLESDVKKNRQNRTVNETLLKEIPDNVTIDKDDVLAILKSRYDFNIGEDGFEIIDNGTVLKNETTRDNLTPNEFLKTFIKPYLKDVQGGKGGKDNRGNAKEGTFEAWDSQMKEQGISGQEYTLALQEAIQKGIVKM